MAALLVVMPIFLSVMAGACIMGAGLVLLLAVIAVGFVTAGIISASMFAGIYTKSVRTGFKTFIVIISTLFGTVTGTLGLYIIVKIFHLNLSTQTAILTGSLGGLGGGILTGFIIYRVIMYTLQYARKKLKLA